MRIEIRGWDLIRTAPDIRQRGWPSFRSGPDGEPVGGSGHSPPVQGSKGSEVGRRETTQQDHTFPMTLTQRLVWRFTTGGEGEVGAVRCSAEVSSFTFDAHHCGVDDKVPTVVKHWA